MSSFTLCRLRNFLSRLCCVLASYALSHTETQDRSQVFTFFSLLPCPISLCCPLQLAWPSLHTYIQYMDSSQLTPMVSISQPVCRYIAQSALR